MITKNYWRVTFIIAVLTFTGGYYFSTIADAGTKKLDFSSFREVQNLLQSHYPFVEKIPSSEKQIEGALKGFVSSYGDPYTVYLPKTDLKSLTDIVNGSFSGIGLEIGMKEGILRVIAPQKNSPAEKAGFLPKDIIYKVSGLDVTTLPTDEVIQKIRGPLGTRVDITIIREGTPGPIVLSPVRETISIPTSDFQLVDGIPVVSLYTFNKESIGQIRAHFEKIALQKYPAFILDLRSNPGGLLDGAIEISSMILDKNLNIVIERPSEHPSKKEDIFYSSGYGIIPKSTKIIVLVDGGSASASEILAGALQDNKRATIIGDQTFGKGSVQKVFDLKSGAGLKMTIAKWYTPTGVSISDKGISPDVVVKDTDYTDNVDAVLQHAVSFIRTNK